MYNLSELINASNLDLIHSDITERSFPTFVDGEKNELVLFCPSVHGISTEGIIVEMMELEGLVPATLAELLVWTRDNYSMHNVVALGSSWERDNKTYFPKVAHTWLNKRGLFSHKKHGAEPHAGWSCVYLARKAA